MAFKQKNKYLLFAAAFFAVVIYFLAIRKTLTLYCEVTKIESGLTLAANSEEQIKFLQKKVVALDRQLKRYLSYSDQNQEHVLDIVSRFCSDSRIHLNDFPPAAITKINDTELETIQFTVEGKFINLLKLVYYLEQQAKTGKIISVKFYSETNYRTMNKQVFATIFLQFIRKKT